MADGVQTSGTRVRFGDSRDEAPVPEERVIEDASARWGRALEVTVGLSSTSQGSLHVTGSGTLADSLVSVGGDLIVGELGQGTLTVDLGAM